MQANARNSSALQDVGQSARRRHSSTIRARIVLLCAEGYENIDIAEKLELCNQTVGK